MSTPIQFLVRARASAAHFSEVTSTPTRGEIEMDMKKSVFAVAAAIAVLACVPTFRFSVAFGW